MLLLLVLGACAAPRHGASLPELAPPRPPSVHAVADERLRDLMGELRALTFEQTPSELELDHQRDRMVIGFADDMVRLSESIDRLAKDQKRLALPPSARPEFLALSGQLYRQALSLKTSAEAGETDAIRPALVRIVQTCNDCHARFRPAGTDLRGVLQPSKGGLK
jgi:hypothetical protein